MRALRLLAAYGLVAVLAVGVAGCGGGGAAAASTPSDDSLARAASARFLDRYVDPDGRVVRRDQGGDTVSEGQAYALLLAAATGDNARFERVWGWTKRHLQRPDGLLSWLWRDGRVVDPQAASDADLDAAHALVLAGQRFGRPDLRAEGARIGAAVLDHETAAADGGRLVLVAGPWAVEGRVVNPSYFSPRAYSALARTGRPELWSQLYEQALRTTQYLGTRDRLPPDWASASSTTQAQAVASPDGRAPRSPRYGFDAARVAVRMGAACDAPSRAVAARLWPVLSDDDAPFLPRRLDGPRESGASRHPLGLVGAAGAARGAGRLADVDRLLAQAATQDRSFPTYYGAAWVALGRVLLTTGLAGTCARS